MIPDRLFGIDSRSRKAQGIHADRSWDYKCNWCKSS